MFGRHTSRDVELTVEDTCLQFGGGVQPRYVYLRIISWYKLVFEARN